MKTSFPLKKTSHAIWNVEPDSVVENNLEALSTFVMFLKKWKSTLSSIGAYLQHAIFEMLIGAP